jgi:hypothetical protein
VPAGVVEAGSGERLLDRLDPERDAQVAKRTVVGGMLTSHLDLCRIAALGEHIGEAERGVRVGEQVGVVVDRGDLGDRLSQPVERRHVST